MGTITGFADVWALVARAEGGDKISLDRNDPGNWTSGSPGTGELKGSKYGISAANFPSTDIANLSYAEAQGLAKAHYWDRYQCDQFNPLVGYLVFDAAYNGGHPAQWLQTAASVTPVDGIIGAATIAAVRGHGVPAIALRFMACRLDYWTQCEAWGSQGKGWVHRGAEIMRTVSDYL